MNEDEEIAKAISDLAKEMKWPETRVAYEAGVSQNAVRKWGEGGRLQASSLLRLMRNMPGLRERLLSQSDAAVA
jgi:hypothetical protein